MHRLIEMLRNNEDAKLLKTMSFVFNFFMIFTELFFLVSFLLTNVNAMIWVVVFNLILSLCGFMMLKKNDLYHWTWAQYFICVDTMLSGVVNLGINYGFQLYSISMMSVAFYIRYVIRKREQYRINPLALSAVTVLIYFTSFYINRKYGPVYTVSDKMEDIFFVYNSVVVFSLVVWYLNLFVNTIIVKEKELERIALVDNLTGLYNRHYLLGTIDRKSREELEGCWIAIIDIDNFKKVNDTYGHNCGDYVLQRISEAARDVCGDCTVCRWGGEEFIIWSERGKADNSILETLREKIAGTHMKYEDRDFCVSVTVGTEKYSSEYSIDEWIDEADKKLYYGKNNGKNQVVY